MCEGEIYSGDVRILLHVFELVAGRSKSPRLYDDLSIPKNPFGQFWPPPFRSSPYPRASFRVWEE